MDSSKTRSFRRVVCGDSKCCFAFIISMSSKKRGFFFLGGFWTVANEVPFARALGCVQTSRKFFQVGRGFFVFPLRSFLAGTYLTGRRGCVAWGNLRLQRFTILISLWLVQVKVRTVVCRHDNLVLVVFLCFCPQPNRKLVSVLFLEPF
jgi:hypothetical protein